MTADVLSTVPIVPDHCDGVNVYSETSSALADNVPDIISNDAITKNLDSNFFILLYCLDY
jgi:hypothetical protein